MRTQRLSDRLDVVLVAHEPPNCEHLGITCTPSGRGTN